MEKNDLRESKKEIPVYRVSSKATKLFLKVIKATSINAESCGGEEREELGKAFYYDNCL